MLRNVFEFGEYFLTIGWMIWIQMKLVKKLRKNPLAVANLKQKEDEDQL